MEIFPFIAAIFVLTSLACAAKPAMIYQSATMGPVGVTKSQLLYGDVPGTTVDAGVFVGVRFELAQEAQVTAIGGHFGSVSDPNRFFGAIVRLSDVSDFPDSDDLSTPDVLGVSRLTFPHPSNEVFGDLTINLGPGWYALVFGSGLFDTDGLGGALRNNSDIAKQSYIGWQANGTGWFDLADLAEFIVFDNHRFVVEGTLIPEPSSSTLVVLAAVMVFGCARTINCERRAKCR
jgi:hypothetical protein